MFYPLQISGKRNVSVDSNPQSYARLYLNTLRNNLKDAGARNIVQLDNELSFKGPFLSFKIYDLRSITNGNVSVALKDNEIVVSYKVRYTILFILCSLAVFGFLLPVMLKNMTNDVALAIIFSVVAWLWLYGVNIALSYSCFRRCLINSQ